MKLHCVVVGLEGDAFAVKGIKTSSSPGDLVHDLKKKIKAEKPNDLANVDANNMQLFLAKKTDAWLKDTDAKAVALDDHGHPRGFQLMEPLCRITKYFNWLFEPKEGEVNVLVVVTEFSIVRPRAPIADVSVKKHHSNVSLKELWSVSGSELRVLPPIEELATYLLRPLPFKLELEKFPSTNEVFAKESPQLQCDDLFTLMNMVTLVCRTPPDVNASDVEWINVYQALLTIPIQFCFANGNALSVVRDHDRTETIVKKQCPDVVLHHKGLILFRGEENSASTMMHESLEALTTKMLGWNLVYYGDLPYVLGYATSGHRLKLVAIDKCLNVHSIVEFHSIIAQQADAMKAFYNLSFLLGKMSTMANGMQLTRLIPFKCDDNGKRKLIALEDKIRCTISVGGCEDKVEFYRLTDSYTKLRNINCRAMERTYLQSVLNLEVSAT